MGSLGFTEFGRWFGLQLEGSRLRLDPQDSSLRSACALVEELSHAPQAVPSAVEAHEPLVLYGLVAEPLPRGATWPEGDDGAAYRIAGDVPSKTKASTKPGRKPTVGTSVDGASAGLGSESGADALKVRR